MSNQIQHMNALLASIDRSGSVHSSNAQLLVPSVLEATLQLDPQAVTGEVTVRVQFEGMLDTDLVSIVWFGTPGVGTPDVEPIPGSAMGYVDFKVPAAAVIANDGTLVSLVAALVRDDEQWVSEPTEVHVGKAVPETVDLVPIITRVIASTGDVAPHGTTIDTEVTIEGIAAPNQQIRLIDGTTSGVAIVTDAYGRWTYTAQDLSVGGHSLTASADYGTGKISEPRSFVVAPIVRFVENFNSVPLGPLDVHTTANVTVKKLSGSPRAERNAPASPYTTGTYYNADRRVAMSIEVVFNGVAKNIKIGLQIEINKPVVFAFYNALGEQIGSSSFTPKAYPSGSWFAYSQASGYEVMSFTMSAPGGFSFDNLTVD